MQVTLGRERAAHLPPDSACDGEARIAGHPDHLEPVRHLVVVRVDSVIHLPIPEARYASSMQERRGPAQQMHEMCLSAILSPRSPQRCAYIQAQSWPSIVVSVRTAWQARNLSVGGCEVRQCMHTGHARNIVLLCGGCHGTCQRAIRRFRSPHLAACTRYTLTPALDLSSSLDSTGGSID